MERASKSVRPMLLAQTFGANDPYQFFQSQLVSLYHISWPIYKHFYAYIHQKQAIL
ncbi:hypothetical protein IMAU10574_03065 [Lactiplantibacillus plantarum]|nr:hypothetical protein [Lactiplantibacillus plantarum]